MADSQTLEAPEIDAEAQDEGKDLSDKRDGELSKPDSKPALSSSTAVSAPDGGITAWLMVLAAWLLFAISWYVQASRSGDPTPERSLIAAKVPALQS